jgi:fluoride ion exporter CrcB/FEX
MTGALKAYYFKYVLPGMIVMSAIFIMLCGFESVLGILVVNVMTILLLGFKINFSKLSLPFSREMIPGGNKNMGATFVYMGICGAVAAVHFFMLKNNPLLNLGVGAIAVVLIKVAFSKALKRRIV